MTFDPASREGSRLRLIARLTRLLKQVADCSRDPYYSLYELNADGARAVTESADLLIQERDRLDRAAFQQSLGLEPTEHRGSRA